MTIGRCSWKVMLAACSLVGGCVVEGPAKPETPKPRPAPRDAGAHPVKVIVSPLSRVGAENAGVPAIQLHLDFRDSGERSTKAYGLLKVDLYQPASVPSGGGASPTQPKAQSWELDLNDPLKNALTFDEMITRTYTITLTGIPDWLVEWSQHKGSATGAPTVVVEFTPAKASGGDRVLRATYALTR